MTTKEKILTLLQKEDTVLSGEKLAQALSISRTAVWKAIKELEKDTWPTAIALSRMIDTIKQHLRQPCR